MCGLAANAGAGNASEDGADYVVAEGKEGGDGAGGVWRDVVAAREPGFAARPLPRSLRMS